MISQHWFRWWIGAVRHRAITWANVDPDLCHQMASLGLNELRHKSVSSLGTNALTINVTQCNYRKNHHRTIYAAEDFRGCKQNLRGHRFDAINSLAPGRPRCHFKTAILNVLLIGIYTASKDNALRWMPWDLTKDKSTLVQLMAWCHQATSHYLSQCWPSSMSPYGVTRPQWVNWCWYVIWFYWEFVYSVPMNHTNTHNVLVI